MQAVGKEIRLVDFLSDSNRPLPYYLGELRGWRERHNVSYGGHFVPHDFAVHEYTTGKTRAETAAEMGFHVTVVPRVKNLVEGIEMTRALLTRCIFDEARTIDGLSALAAYRRQWDEQRKVYLNQPVHDWASHPADALRQLAQGWAGRVPKEFRIENTVEEFFRSEAVELKRGNDWDPYED